MLRSGFNGCCRWVTSILVPSVGTPGLAVACLLVWGGLKQGRCGQMVISIYPLFIGPCAEFDFHNKALKFVRFAHWDLRSYAAAAP